jgi:uncharacterized membrane protein
MVEHVESDAIWRLTHRQAAKDRLRADFDLETNLKAETLIAELHGSMETLRITQWAELLQLQQSQIGMLQALVGRLEADAARSGGAPAEGR